ELSRLLRLSVLHHIMFLLAVSILLAGLLLLALGLVYGGHVIGLGMLALAWWLLQYDIARRTVWQTGLTRFIAVCLLSGYVWLGVGGVLTWRFAGIVAGPYYDAMLHTVFVGFVFAIIFAHRRIILPH